MKECNNSISKIHISSNVIFSILWFYSSHIIDILHLVDITNEYIDIRFTEFATLIYIYVCVCIYIYIVIPSPNYSMERTNVRLIYRLYIYFLLLCAGSVINILSPN